MLQAADFVSATIRKYTAASWRKLLADQANRIAALEAEVRAQSAVIDNLEAELRRRSREARIRADRHLWRPEDAK
jgi:hypothetical protein